MNRWRLHEAPVSHFLMDGGVLRVDDQSAFDSDYLHELLCHNKHCIVEKRTEKFRFFVDFDYKSDSELSSVDIINLAVGMNSITKHKCYIARTDIRSIDNQLKTGVHFHWPELVANKQEAIKIRNQIVLKFPEYADAIDESVYTGSGLRLVWSYKYQAGKFYQPYVPWKSVTVSGLVEHLSSQPFMETLRLFTIRIPDSESESEKVECNSTLLEAYINKYIPGQKDARVLKIFLTRDGESLGAQTDSKYCSRIGRVHRRNHAWFWIKNGTIKQMCLDSDCKSYVGREYILPPSILQELKQ